ncbi:MAG TPA: universal stress protein [Mycobacteriales bacterium]|nr:universal stress protein [Mycobacteriales bacterium]
MKGIVVGVDRSAAARAAAQWALAEGLRRGRPVTAVNAWVDPVTAGYPIAVAMEERAEAVASAALATAQEVLKEATDAVPAADGVDAHAVAVRGAPAAVLTEASRDADLVVVGTRGHGALSRAVLGSVSGSLLHHAHAPVAVVPEPRAPGRRPARVVVGVDHSPAAAAALEWAARAAAARGAVLVPVLVREPTWRLDSPPGALSASLAQLEENERSALRAAVPAELAVRVEPEVVPGHAAAALLHLVEPQDLLVVGSRGRGGFTGLLLGSTSTSVAQHAPCPVVVVRSAAG